MPYAANTDQAAAEQRVRLGANVIEDCTPKGLVMDAWKASVGYSRDRACSQRFVTHAGTCHSTRRTQLTRTEDTLVLHSSSVDS